MTTRVVVLGAGYAGVRSALTLETESKRNEAEIELVNKHNYHYFMAQLHESATGVGGNEDIRVPLDEVFKDTRVKLIKDIVLRILPGDNRVLLEGGTVTYDYLIIALGSEPEYFSIPGLEQYSFTLRSLNSAKLIRTHIENNFATFKANPLNADLLTIVVGGAGFTGIELAGEIADWVPRLAKEYDIDEKKVSVINIEAASSILKGYDRQLIDKAYQVLQDKGIRIITGIAIESVSETEVRLSDGEVIKTQNFIWTGGIRANKLIAQSGFTCAARGRARVNEHLQSVDYSNVFIVGDNAFICNPSTGEVMGPTAQVAIQSGRMAALNVLAEIRGEDLRVCNPRELGRVVSLGRKSAVGKIGRRYRTTGRVAGLLKDAIQWKYLYSLGGLALVAKKMLR